MFLFFITFLKDRAFLVRINGMANIRSRLNTIRNWEDLGRQANYDAVCLAEISGVCPDHLRRWFQQTRGKTAQQWLGELRLSDAPALLAKPITISQVSRKLAYARA